MVSGCGECYHMDIPLRSIHKIQFSRENRTIAFESNSKRWRYTRRKSKRKFPIDPLQERGTIVLTRWGPVIQILSPWPNWNLSLKRGVVTAANSSKISDGAARLLMSKEKAQALGVKPWLKSEPSCSRRWIGGCVGGSDSVNPKSSEKASLSLKDIDLFEINEAFLQLRSYLQNLGIDRDKVNVHVVL